MQPDNKISSACRPPCKIIPCRGRSNAAGSGRGMIVIREITGADDGVRTAVREPGSNGTNEVQRTQERTLQWADSDRHRILYYMGGRVCSVYGTSEVQ